MSDSAHSYESTHTSHDDHGTSNSQRTLLHPEIERQIIASQDARLNQRVQDAIGTYNLIWFLILLGEGAAPMMLLPNGALALDFAIQNNCSDMVCFFHWCAEGDIANIGMRALLTATMMRKTEIVETILDIGMRERLGIDDDMKLLVFGWMCKHGTPELLGMLQRQGHQFDWRAFWYWCWLLTSQTGNALNGTKVIELRNEYMQREWEVNPFGLPDESTQNRRIARPLHRLLEIFVYTHPEWVIQDYWEFEYSLPNYEYHLDLELNVLW
ncbi:hypothetical protein BDV06DRAFT_222529 [Aspergillus oleicola]